MRLALAMLVLSSAAAAAQDAHQQYVAAGISCATCHPCGAAPVHSGPWMDPATTGFHAATANAGLANCQGCHGAALDGINASTAVSCAACHGADWKTNCTMCHGGTDNQTGAPPGATWGNGADPVRVGAHTAHLGATHGLARPTPCASCHVVPADALTAGHVDAPTATVAFGGIAAQGSAPAWNRASATCSNTYCHGATLPGGTAKAPVWTSSDASLRACGACHGSPPPDANHGRTDLDCSNCHGAGYSATAATVVQASHADGKIDVALTCTSCHGDPARAGSIAAAPPKGTHGETSTTSRAVGAHLQHLQPGKLAMAIACTECHSVPTSPVHANGATTLTWGPLAKANGAAPVWTSATATCSANWCHGAKLTGGGDTSPVWTTVNGSQDTCGTCHGVPPSSGQHDHRGHDVSCSYCHASGYSSSAVNTALHVDGILEVQGSRIRSWDASTQRCQPSCHGSQTWSGGSGWGGGGWGGR